MDVSRLGLLALVLVAAWPAAPAAADSGRAGPVEVTVEPTTGLADGDVVTITAAATGGADLFEIRAHLCFGDARVSNRYDFSFDGAYCTMSPVSAASQAESITVVAPGSGGTGALDFRVGTGTGEPWTDLDGQTHQLTCSETDLCDLVVQLEITGDTVFFTAPLSFGSAPARSRPAEAAPGSGEQALSSPTNTAPVIATAASGGDADQATAAAAAASSSADSASDLGGGSSATRWIVVATIALCIGLLVPLARQGWRSRARSGA